ncbi:uncharacterized protein MONOS_16172 [Monocercomonoides exilis]|uniref:uncharacterized protein n=1 Tax=Monocercomonoides exilis TaxID=2049356 RepID=UPI00355940FE|nr:hypothetical protein MONOS_16172 [Monocercomonoides exilis]|eukprot:MONOS_16172.1-p1 / transcript=MONOS_16172.1 / gene=MONOS_16172 / organism=Monocercomonoides_exilis_PA203 / gene_product=unspecified product / transcript_product=unspecified product / location=Mono_scaffold01540:952-2448(+) / protein_length=326 / sequence_SO=supercontig / SO=protein_coding / is_pseudo=false
MSSERRIGKSESDLFISCLEESDLEQPSIETDDSFLHLEMLSRRPFPGTGNVEVGSRTSSRGVYGCKDRMVARVGERWWSKGLRACGVPDKIRKITERSISKVTWNQYTNCFAHFHIEWKSNQLGEIPGCFDEWIKKCATTHTPLAPSGIRKLANVGLGRAGVPEEFRPYTIKHATISKVSTEGIPEACAARFARLSTTAHTPLRSFFKTNLASQMAHMLLPQSSGFQLSDEGFRKEKVQRLQSENISIGTTQQTTSITFGRQFEQSSDISAEASASPIDAIVAIQTHSSGKTVNQDTLFPSRVEEPEGEEVTEGEQSEQGKENR